MATKECGVMIQKAAVPLLSHFPFVSNFTIILYAHQLQNDALVKGQFGSIIYSL